jgi:hypothetical protein
LSKGRTGRLVDFAWQKGMETVYMRYARPGRTHISRGDCIIIALVVYCVSKFVFFDRANLIWFKRNMGFLKRELMRNYELLAF